MGNTVRPRPRRGVGSQEDIDMKDPGMSVVVKDLDSWWNLGVEQCDVDVRGTETQEELCGSPLPCRDTSLGVDLEKEINKTGATAEPCGDYSLTASVVTHTSTSRRHQSLGPPVTASWNEKKQWGEIIRRAMQPRYVALLSGVDPGEAANLLFEKAIISDNEREKATEHGTKKDRAGTLIALLITKLGANPHWFEDTCEALEKAGVQSIISEIRGEIQQEVESSLTAKVQSTKLNPEEMNVMMSCTSQPDQPQSDIFNEKERTTPLHIICMSLPQGSDNAKKLKRRNDIAELRRLLDGGADCGNQDLNGNTPLHIAVLKQDVEVVLLMITHLMLKGFAANVVCIQNKNLATPLHYACSSRILDLVKPFLKCSNSRQFVNTADDNGDTALHLCTRNSCIEIMKLLRKSHADPKLKNHADETPIDIANNSLHRKAFKILTEKKYGALLDLPLVPWNKKKKEPKVCSSHNIHAFNWLTDI